MTSSSKMYKTLPGPLRPKEEKKKQQDHTHSPLFGLNLNLNFSNLISSGVNFWDNLRKKTPSTPSGTDSSSPSLSSCSLGTTSLCEAIEMSPIFPPAEALGEGEGHIWREVGSHNPTWCDLCGELIWGLYDTGAWQCCSCSYTSHVKCRDRVRIDCSANHFSDCSEVLEEEIVKKASFIVIGVQDDTDGMVQSLLRDDDEELDSTFSSYTTAKADQLTSRQTVCISLTNDTLVDGEQFHTLQDVEDLTHDKTVPSLLSLPPEQLNSYIQNYNSTLPPGQETSWIEEHNYFSGFIRVDMNLARPINVISGTRPPSIYNMMSEDTINDKTLTTFYLPPGTEKALHITSQTTTQDVIRVLLKKFRVADNPHKYALYERNDDFRRESFPKSKSLSRLKLRRLNEDEKPLVLAILWGKEKEDTKKFVLQENDPGEIQWDRFSLPELKNFLLILDREEAWYKRRIHEKYETVQEVIHDLLQEKRPDKDKEKEAEKEKDWI